MYKEKIEQIQDKIRSHVSLQRELTVGDFNEIQEALTDFKGLISYLVRVIL